MAGRKWKQKKSSKLGVVSITFVVMLLFTMISYKSIDLKEKLNEAMERQISIEKKIEKEEQRQQELEEYGKYIQTIEYVIERARDMGLVFENEIWFVPNN